MDDLPEDDLAESRAALAPTLDATAAILPWVAKTRRPASTQAERALVAAVRNASTRRGPTGTAAGADAFGRQFFNLYAIALDTADGDCLRAQRSPGQRRRSPGGRGP